MSKKNAGKKGSNKSAKRNGAANEQPVCFIAFPQELHQYNNAFWNGESMTFPQIVQNGGDESESK